MILIIIQERTCHDVSDERRCRNLEQPWRVCVASLVESVSGIRQLEGCINQTAQGSSGLCIVKANLLVMQS